MPLGSDPIGLSAASYGKSYADTHGYSPINAKILNTIGAGIDIINSVRQSVVSSVPSSNSFVSATVPNTGYIVPSEPTWSYTNADLAQSYGMDRSTAYQEALANTSHQREVADLKAAGLNPVLSANGGSGAAVFSGSEYSTSAAGGGSAAAQPLLNSNSAKAFGALAGALIGAVTHTSVSDCSSIGELAGAAVSAIVNPQ